MAGKVDYEAITRDRMVWPRYIGDGTFDQAQYPHRLICLSEPSIRGWATNMTLLLTAAELLVQAGWELVNVSRVEDRHLVAILRRP